MTLREAIRAAIARALETRGCCDVELERDGALRVSVIAAADGSLEVLTNDRGSRKGLRRRREALDRYEMAAVGFQPQRDIWVLLVPGLPGAAERAADGIERLFTGPLERSLDEGAGLWFDYPGLVPDRPVPPPDAPHVEHLQASMAIFELDPEADVIISAGAPSDLFLQFSLAGDNRVEVHVTGRGGERPPPIAGYTDSPEIERALWAEHERETFPRTAADLLHDQLGVAEGDPLFVYLSSGALP